MKVDCWAVLGMARSVDEREIKRAYARLLKQQRPDEEPAAFQALREAFEEALYQAAEAFAAGAGSPVITEQSPLRQGDELAAETVLRPHIEELAALNEHGDEADTMAKLAEVIRHFHFDDAAKRDPLLWELFEDGMLWVCCDIAANHDDFLRAAMQMFGWAEPDNWLAEKDPKTVEWLKLRLCEAEALELVDELLNLYEAGEESTAMATLLKVVEDERLINIDVRQLFEAELMVGLSEFLEFPALLTKAAADLFAWKKDHRHLSDYNPDAWQKLSQQAGWPDVAVR